MQFSDWLFDRTEQTHAIALPRLFLLIHEYMVDELGANNEEMENILHNDFALTGLKGSYLNRKSRQNNAAGKNKAFKRQLRHASN
jgi:hypothetical protein